VSTETTFTVPAAQLVLTSSTSEREKERTRQPTRDLIYEFLRRPDVSARGLGPKALHDLFYKDYRSKHGVEPFVSFSTFKRALRRFRKEQL
jgi:hypothetical protein